MSTRFSNPRTEPRPQLAGKNLANPLAMILSAAMMLEWLAEIHADKAAAAAGKMIERAVARMLEAGQALPTDLGGAAGTDAVARAVIEAL
jgi:3-isopropylmalate dehydrogenase